jgi:hypothetical protein
MEKTFVAQMDQDRDQDKYRVINAIGGDYFLGRRISLRHCPR